MFGGDYDGYDERCQACGRGYYFDVGWGGCPYCNPYNRPDYSPAEEPGTKTSEEEIEEFIIARDFQIQLRDDDDDERPY